MAATTGRRMTRLTTPLQNRDSPAGRRSRLVNGIRPFSTRSPSQASTAGSTSSETNISTATTLTVATANDSKVASPVMNMPDMAIITVIPEISTARPEVRAAASRDSCGLLPLARSSRSRRM